MGVSHKGCPHDVRVELMTWVRVRDRVRLRAVLLT